ncbi:MAG: hypothetical protein ACTS3F_09420 [Phycisphaerales bacterium]
MAQQTPSRFYRTRRIIREAIVFTGAGLAVTVLIAWACAAFISIAQAPQYLAKISIEVPRQIDAPDRVLPIRGWRDTHWSGVSRRYYARIPSTIAHPDITHPEVVDEDVRTYLSITLRLREATIPGANRKSVDMKAFDMIDFISTSYGPGYFAFEVEDSKIVDSLYNLAHTKSRWLLVLISKGTPAEHNLNAIPGSQPFAIPHPIHALPRDIRDGTRRPTLDEVRHIAAAIPAEQDARGWPFLCLYSRIHEHRDDALALAGRPVTGGIRLPPRKIPLTTSQAAISQARNPNQLTLREARALPLIPIWPGLLANTAIYAAALWLLTLAPLRLRRTLRARKGHCPHCAYDLNNLTTDRCPECGRSASMPGDATAPSTQTNTTG